MTIRIAFVRNAARAILKNIPDLKPPISMTDIASRLKLEIGEYSDMPSDRSALILQDKKMIVINPKHADVRKRFSIAHEIGHYVLGHFEDRNIEELENEDNDEVFRKTAYDKWSSDQESEANEFAAELLMPYALLKNLVTNKKPAELAEIFNVSEESMWIRLTKQKLIKYL